MDSARSALSSSPFPKDLVGSRIGRFKIRSMLGAGGMGEVYYAEDMTLQRPVALKRVNRKLGSDPEARRHILREAQRASALSSEHIASVYDVVENNDELFLVMEYVQGITLRTRLAGPGRMPLDAFHSVALQCAEALTEAQEKGILHRDLKPENIMLAGADSRVKILDFGLARRLPIADENAITASVETQSMDRAGTPGYMAPEVLLEQGVDGRADIFSLGVVFYEMLTGQHPFGTEKLIGTADHILHSQPRPIRELARGVPRELERIVNKMLAKDPALRYQSAQELLADLRNLQPAEVTKPWLKVLADRGKRLTWRSTIVSSAALLICAVAAWGFHQWIRPPIKPAARSWVLITDFDNFGDSSVPDKGVREALTIALEQSRYVNVLSRPRAYEALQRMKRRDVTRIDEGIGREICRRENVQVLLAGSIARVGGTFQIGVQAIDPVHGSLLLAEKIQAREGGAFFDEVDFLARRVRARLGESMAVIEGNSKPLAKVTTNSLEALQLYSQALDYIARGRYEEAPGLLQSSIAKDPNFAMAYLRLGDCYSSVIGKNEKAAAEMQRAYELRAAVTERERLWIEGQYQDFQENYDLAARSFTALASLYPDDAEAHEQLAQASENLGRLDMAIAEQRRALELNPNSTSGFVTLILWLAGSNQNEEAIRTYQLASERGMDSPYLRWGLGMAYLGREQMSEARQQFQAMSRSSPVESDLGQLYLAVADLYEGKLQAAEAALSAGLPARSTGRESFSSIRRYLLGRIRLLLSDGPGAQHQAEMILAMPSSDLQTIDLLNAGKILVDVRNMRSARQVLRRLEAIRQEAPTGWNNASFHCLEGEVLVADEKVDEAIKSLQAATREFPDPTFHLGLAHAYQRKSDWAAASQELELFLNARCYVLQHGFPPDLALTHLELARAYGRMNDLTRARIHYQQFLAMWRQADDLPGRGFAARELQQLESRQ